MAKKESHGMASLFDAPSTKHPSIWPEKKLAADSSTNEVLARIPDCLERAREALSCVESRCARAGKALSGAGKGKLEDIGEECREWLSELTRMRKDVDALIAAGKEKSEDLF